MNALRRKWEKLPCGRSSRGRVPTGREAVSRAEALSKLRGGKSLVVVGEAEKEEDGRRRTVGLCGAPRVFWASRCSRVVR